MAELVAETAAFSYKGQSRGSSDECQMHVPDQIFSFYTPFKTNIIPNHTRERAGIMIPRTGRKISFSLRIKLPMPNAKGITIIGIETYSKVVKRMMRTTPITSPAKDYLISQALNPHSPTRSVKAWMVISISKFEVDGKKNLDIYSTSKCGILVIPCCIFLLLMRRKAQSSRTHIHSL